MLLSSCGKESTAESSGADVVVLNVTPSLGLPTRAVIDSDGHAAWADRCRLQIIMKKGGSETLVYDKVMPVDVATHKTEFKDIKLVRNQKYDFMLWADNADGAYYNTDDLRNVTVSGSYVGCNDKRDAFSAAIADTLITAGCNLGVVLYRPFAQLNVISNDVNRLKDQLPAGAQLADVLPNKVALSFTAPDTFNVLTAAASGEKAFTYESAVYTRPYKSGTDSLNTLSMDYILAPVSEPSVNSIGFTAKNDTPAGSIQDVSLTFQNIPLKRNFRTNIVGFLLTDKVDVKVEIQPAWNTPDYTEER